MRTHVQEEDTCSDAEQAHAPESIHMLVINPTHPAPPAPPTPPPPPADHIEVGTVWADLTEVTVDYAGDYTSPVIIAGIPTEVLLATCHLLACYLLCTARVSVAASFALIRNL
jgi:hypothetical protein